LRKYQLIVVGKGEDMFCACQTSLTIGKRSMLSMLRFLRLLL